jgi:uncharacterized protein DUF6968
MQKRKVRGGIGQIFASRILTDRSSPDRTITVSIGVPRRDGPNWECLLLIEGLGKPEVVTAGGVDSLQALLGAIRQARTILDKEGQSIVWFDAWPGIPSILPTGIGKKVEGRIEALIEREYKRRSETKFREYRAEVLKAEAASKSTGATLNEARNLKKRKDHLARWEKNLRDGSPGIPKNQIPSECNWGGVDRTPPRCHCRQREGAGVPL